MTTLNMGAKREHGRRPASTALRAAIEKEEPRAVNASAGKPVGCRISLIVEWENAQRIGSRRAEKMLAALGPQLAGLPPAVRDAEILFIHDGSPDSASAIEAAARAAALPVPWRTAVSPDPSYAGQKRHGARLARGEILVFLDSDVIPQPGWLEGLVGPFSRRETEVVCGATYIEPHDFYSATMALGWLFPLRPRESGLVEVEALYANNFALRRDIFLALPAPPCEGYRDGTMRMVETLRQRGHPILLNRGAAVAHPPPEGARRFALRALWSGLDNALGYRRRRACWRGSAVMLADLFRAWVRVGQNYRKVGLGPGRAAAAVGLMSIYYLLRLAGYAAGLAAPGPVRRRLAAAEERS
jgi:hypothetical protein